MQLVLRGAGERLRPILMTTGAAGLAILPLVIFGDLPGHEIEYPMAVVILGGLVTSTLLNLFILPAFYLRFGRGTGALTDSLTVPGAAQVCGERDVKTVHRHNGWMLLPLRLCPHLRARSREPGPRMAAFKSSPFISSAMYRIMIPRSGSRPPARRMGWLREGADAGRPSGIDLRHRTQSWEFAVSR